MDLIDRLHELGRRIKDQRGLIHTEEAAKTAFILPFLQLLGYDVFNPAEVVPEFIADVGMKKGEKVDYALKNNGEVVAIIECKMELDADTTSKNEGQLLRYFHVTSARIGILTDGITWRFYTDLDDKNKMDDRPFLEICLYDLKPHLVKELKKLTKSEFDIDDILTSAGDLKYMREIKRVLSQDMSSPSAEFVLYLLKQTYNGSKTQSVKDQFSKLVPQAFSELLYDEITSRLQSIGKQPEQTPVSEDMLVLEDPSVPSQTPVATDEEREGYWIVKAVLRDKVDPQRIVMRDQLSYCAILLDNNNRKTICRFFFAGKHKRLQFGNKQEDRVPLDDLNDIYKYADRLVALLDGLLQPSPTLGASGTG